MAIRIISASAGTGKTYRLSEILSEEIRNGSVRPEKIIATTYTVKAASELKERVRRRLIEDRRREAAIRLQAARIGTVHSICVHLVSDFSFELGLSPELEVIEDKDAMEELQRAFSGVMRPMDYEKLLEYEHLFVAYNSARNTPYGNPKGIKDIVLEVVTKARVNRLGAADLKSCAERSIDTLLNALGGSDLNEYDGPGDGFMTTLKALLKDFVGACTPGAPEQAPSDAYKTSQGILRVLERRGRRPSWDELRKLMNSRVGEEENAYFEPLRAHLSTHHLSRPFLADMKGFIEFVFDLAARSLDKYQEQKRIRGMVDFVDQETFALDLLEREDIRQHLEDEIDLLLVDEFQDTSPIQLAIFLRLSSIAKQSVWVGDKKQAIYRFRDTDPRLMDAVLERVSKARSKEILNRSWRSGKRLVESTSNVFKEPFKRLGGLSPDEVEITSALSDENSIQGHCYEKWELRGREKVERFEEIAHYVDAFLKDETILVRDPDEKTPTLRRPKRGDIAILCTTNNDCRDVANALNALGIKAQLDTTSPFDTLEGILLKSALHVLFNPSDTLPKAEILRILRYPHDPDGLLDAMLDRMESEMDQCLEINRLFSMSKEAMTLGPITAIDLAVDALGIKELCARWGNSEERILNLEAMRNMAVDYVEAIASKGYPVTLGGFLAHIDSGATMETPGRVGNFVRVLTWHGAKGLEWPVVILVPPSRDKKPSVLKVDVVHESQGLDLDDPLRGRFIRFWPNPYWETVSKTSFHDLISRSKAMEHERIEYEKEELRLLYVAWTRARDMLILAENGKNGLKKGPFKHVNLEKTLFSSDAWSKYVFSRPHPQADVSIQEDKQEGIQPCSPEASSLEEIEIEFVEPLRPEDGGYAPLYLSPSRNESRNKIDVEAKDMRLEFFTVADRIPVPASIDMASFGNAYHLFMGSCFSRNYLALDGDQRDQKVQRLAMSILEDHGITGDYATYFTKTFNNLVAWMAEKWHPLRFHPEFPVSYVDDRGTLVSGFSDLVVEHPSGIAVVDYKTFPGSKKEMEDRCKEEYIGQLASYATAIKRSDFAKERAVEMWVYWAMVGKMIRIEH